MSEPSLPRLPKWPFLAAAVILLAVAGHIAVRGPSPFAMVPLLCWVGAVVLAGVAAVLPFLLEYRALSRMVETDVMSQALDELHSLEALARNVTAATSQWQAIQERAGQTQLLARETAERMAFEAKEFTDFIKRANDNERATLRLEVEKLRRVEGDWLQVVVSLLDHVFALTQAGTRSGRPELMQQFGMFQHVCRDLARRVGVSALDVQPGEAFDPEKHRLPETDAEVPEDGTISEFLAQGILFQGRLLRPAVVRVKAAVVATPEETAPEAPLEGGPAPGADAGGEQAKLL